MTVTILRALLLLGLAMPALAQRVPVIGYLAVERPASSLDAFKRGLAELNFVEGRNVAIEYRSPNGDNAKLPELAAELVARKVSVLVAPGSAAASAAKKATAAIPIVFLVGDDPVRAGLVRSMSHPGGNATGITSLGSEMGPKRLQLLREVVPGMKSFALLINPSNASNAEAVINDLQVASHAQRLQFQVVGAATEQDLAVVFENLARERVGGLIIANDTFFVNRGKELGALALQHKVPAIHLTADFVAAGGLMSYAASFEESHRLVGVYAGRVLRGERPADLPVQQAAKMELAINAKAAKALDLDISPSVLARADRVIR